jgi:hypothetical protein
MENNIVNASPTKDFFINMITKDISLEDAIIELVDNSIDGAKAIRGGKCFQGLFVKISFDDNSFCINDNCGGISLETAQNHAFRFGKDKEDHINYSLGRFGIGMKRALFKLGKNFLIKSQTSTESFTLPVDVNTWTAKDEWEFSFSEKYTNQDNAPNTCGTTIEISNLVDDVARNFKDGTFHSKICRTLENKLSEFIKLGIQILVNEIPIDYSKYKLFFSETIKPAYYETKINNVNVKIIAGVVEKGAPAESGWYIACNNRFIVLHDQSNKTVWGNGIAQHHPEDAAFRGYVFLSSENASDLPWNTTKTSIDFDTDTFRYIRSKMIGITKSVRAFTKKANDLGINFNNFLRNSSYVAVSDVLNKTDGLNENFQHNLPDERIRTKTITFKKAQDELDSLKRYMNVSNYKDIGLKMYDYYIEMEDIEL